MKNNSVIKPILIVIAAMLFTAFCFDISVGTIKHASFVFLVICTAICVIAFKDKIGDKALFATMLSGMFLKLAYVIYTPVWCRQHDVIDFGAGEGHAAYMEYILSNKALPDFDPRSVWAFFQPPLHHMISAAWMWFNIKCGIVSDHMHKNVQILPLLYMCALMYITYLICRELKMRNGGTLVTMLVVSFHPVFVMMSGSINNDALSVTLSVLAIYIAIVWYMYPTTGKIILLALSIGLAMSAKLSAGLVAPPVAFIMIYKIVKDTDRFRDRAKLISYILELAVFAVIVFPLGLWWPVRNKILFDMPVNYIPEVGEHVSKSGPVAAIFDVGTASPFLYMKSNGYAYDEYNLILATLKSSLFGEGDYEGISALLTVSGWVLLSLLVIVIAWSIAAIIGTLSSKKVGAEKGIGYFLLAGIVSFVGGYVSFALAGQNLSAMDFRYAAAAIPMASLFAGLWYDLSESRALRVASMIVSGAFAAASAAFYILVGIYT